MEKVFFDLQVKMKNDYTTSNLLDFAYFKKNHKLIAIDLSKQTKLKDPQQVNFIGKLENQDMEQQCFLLQKNQKKLLSIFLKILLQLYKSWIHKRL